MKRLGRWIKKHFKVKGQFGIDWHSFILWPSVAWTWNNTVNHFSTGPVLGIFFFMFGLEVSYKKNKAFI